MKRILSFVAAVLVFAACSKETPSVQDVSLYVSEESGSDLEGRDFSVYVVAKKSSSSENLSSRLYDGVFAGYNGGMLQFSENLAYDFGKPYCDFYVFAPYKENILPGGSSLAEIAVEPDQAAGPEGSDVLFGKTLNFIRKDEDPRVVLSHLFSRLDFVVETSNPAGAFDEVTMKNVVMGGSFDVKECNFILSSTVGDVKSYGDFGLSGDGLLRGVSVILPPQKIASGDFATIMVGGEEHGIRLDNALELEPGKSYEVGISITAELNPELRVGDITVRDWESDTLDFSSDKLVPPGNTVTDIEGNEYPVVKIGGQYWMGANLRTTKLNDGTDIYKVENLGEWPVTDKAAYTVYNLDFEGNPDRWGLLYNHFCIEYEKLCPEGWHVPTTTDWDMLGMSQGGTPDEASCFADVTEGLKSTDGWSGFPGTNATGFDGYPVGYLFSYVQSWDGDTPIYYSGFGYNNETAGWWSTSGYWNESLFFRAFVSYSYDMERFSVPSFNAFPVRCVADYTE